MTTAAQSLQAVIDRDLLACRYGPMRLDEALETLTRDELERRYRGLLARVEMKAALRRLDANTSAVRAELAQERRDLFKGGNR